MESGLGELWEAAKTAGPFGAILGIIWALLERADRRDCQKKVEALQDRTLTTLNGMSSTLDRIMDHLTRARR